MLGPPTTPKHPPAKCKYSTATPTVSGGGRLMGRAHMKKHRFFPFAQTRARLRIWSPSEPFVRPLPGRRSNRASAGVPKFKSVDSRHKNRLTNSSRGGGHSAPKPGGSPSGKGRPTNSPVFGCFPFSKVRRTYLVLGGSQLDWNPPNLDVPCTPHFLHQWRCSPVLHIT